MQHDEFLGHVQDRARLASRGEAERLARAALETLGERIPEGLAESVAAQLPHEIGEHLRRTVLLAGAGTGERFARDEFAARVAERSGMDPPAALYGARVVFEVIDQATSGKVLGKVRASLPDDLAVLVSAGSEGPLEERGTSRRTDKGG